MPVDINHPGFLHKNVSSLLRQLKTTGESCLVFESVDDNGEPLVVIVAKGQSAGPARVLARQMVRNPTAKAEGLRGNS